MKKVFFALFFVSSIMTAQDMEVVKGDFGFLKDQKEVNYNILTKQDFENAKYRLAYEELYEVNFKSISKKLDNFSHST